MVTVEERAGNWVRTAKGYLPLSIGDARIFETADVPRLPGTAADARTSQPCHGTTLPPSRPWSLLPLGWPGCLLMTLSAGSYVAFRATVLYIRWCSRMTFSLF